MLAKAPKVKSPETIAAEAAVAEAAHAKMVDAILNDDDRPPPACAWPRQPRSVDLKKSDGIRWMLLQARSGAETKLTDFLKQFGYEVYYPKTSIWKQVKRRDLTKQQRADGAVIMKPQLVPIFPTYPFIRFDAGDARCHDIFSFGGVYGLHCAAGRPVVVDDWFVAHLKSLEDDGVIPATTPLRHLFDIGETARINDGPFRHFNAVVEELPAKLQQQIATNTLEELDDSMCAIVGVSIFGRVSRVSIPLRSLDKI